ncbi:LOW QUALITY PROTEIN: urea transporter 2 [Polymixia lowei]
MWIDTKPEGKQVRPGAGVRQRLVNALLRCCGDMVHLDKYMEDKLFVVQLVLWSLRGAARVILANNPLSGALILAALYWASPWQGLLGTVGLLASTLTAVIIGQDSVEVSGGLHGFNGMLVSLLMGVFSSAGDWYWWLLLPACLGSAACTFMFSGLSSVLDRWDLPVAVFPFNIVILLYLLCTGPDNLYYPHHLATPPGALEPNATQLSAEQCICMSMVVRHGSLYSGLSGFNGALGCMAVGGLFFTFSWRTHLFAIASAFLSAYADIALSNLLGTVGLPACSWASTLIATHMLLLTGQSLAVYRIPIGQVRAPEHNLRSHSHGKPLCATGYDPPGT